MSEKHRMEAHDSLIMGHPAIVEMQGKMGSNGFLDTNGSSGLNIHRWLCHNAYDGMIRCDIIQSEADNLGL